MQSRRRLRLPRPQARPRGRGTVRAMSRRKTRRPPRQPRCRAHLLPRSQSSSVAGAVCSPKRRAVYFIACARACRCRGPVGWRRCTRACGETSRSWTSGRTRATGSSRTHSATTSTTSSSSPTRCDADAHSPPKAPLPETVSPGGSVGVVAGLWLLFFRARYGDIYGLKCPTCGFFFAVVLGRRVARRF